MTTKPSQDPKKIAADQEEEIKKAEEKTSFKIVPVSVVDKAKDSDKSTDEILEDEVKNKAVIPTEIGNAEPGVKEPTSTINMVADNVVVLDK